jgi:hypothetical protein
MIPRFAFFSVRRRVTNDALWSLESQDDTILNSVLLRVYDYFQVHETGTYEANKKIPLIFPVCFVCLKLPAQSLAPLRL